MAKHNDTRTIDIHGLTAAEAKNRIEKEIAKAPAMIKRIIVIHGYNKGDILQKTVRTQVRSKRILEISPSFTNDGETIIYLK
jgi:DNA-nicking Smr family endonuclease